MRHITVLLTTIYRIHSDKMFLNYIRLESVARVKMIYRVHLHSRRARKLPFVKIISQDGFLSQNCFKFVYALSGFELVEYKDSLPILLRGRLTK